MFTKILIANRGEIAVRIIRTCREMGIRSVAVYTAGDQNSLHVRLADECAPLTTERGYQDGDEIVRVALTTGTQAIHPGYGFLAERADFAAACSAAGIVFIGPSTELLATFQNKIRTLERVQQAGFRTPPHSPRAIAEDEEDLLHDFAGQMRFPLIVKSCSGGRGRGTRVIGGPEQLDEKVRQARREAQNVFGDTHLYLEEAIAPARMIEVQILADQQGNLIHLGEREGSIQRHTEKLVAEAPAPNLSDEQRAELWRLAVAIGRLFAYRGAGTLEFLLDGQGDFYFTEIKPRIQVEHPVTEMVTAVDIVRQQIRIAVGEPLEIRQADVVRRGWAMQCRVSAVDPWNHYLVSPGTLRRYRLPGGAHVRVDTYGCAGCQVPLEFDPILAKVVVWGETREVCLVRLRRALAEFVIRGVRTNLPLLQQVVDTPDFVAGVYNTLLRWGSLDAPPLTDPTRNDLAIIAAVAFAMRSEAGQPVLPARVLSGWHRSSRNI